MLNLFKLNKINIFKLMDYKYNNEKEFCIF